MYANVCSGRVGGLPTLGPSSRPRWKSRGDSWPPPATRTRGASRACVLSEARPGRASSTLYLSMRPGFGVLGLMKAVRTADWKLVPRLGGRRRIPPRCCWASWVARDTLPALGPIQRAWLNLAIVKKRLVKHGGMTQESVDCAGTNFDRAAEDGSHATLTRLAGCLAPVPRLLNGAETHLASAEGLVLTAWISHFTARCPP
jgi:hypothetical protein